MKISTLKLNTRHAWVMATGIALCAVTTLTQAQSRNNPQPVNQGRPTAAIAQSIDSRVVEFPFDKNGIFEIRTKLERFTRLTFAEGESIRGFYLSDTVSWEYHVAADKQNVFIKPKVPGADTTATLQTNKRSYDLDFKTVADNDKNWHQRASWAPEMGNFGSMAGNGSSNVSSSNSRFFEAPASTVVTSASTAPSLPCNPLGSNKRMRYSASGDPQFIPVQAWDDGQFTCLQMPTNFQDMPALFVLDREGNAEIADAKLRENMIIVPRVMEFGGLLKLGKAEVVVKNIDAKTTWNMGGSWNRPANVSGNAGMAYGG